MTALQVFILSMLVGWAGLVGFVTEHTFGRMNRYTRLSEMTNRQWVFAYMMMQFIAALLVGALYLIFKNFA